MNTDSKTDLEKYFEISGSPPLRGQWRLSIQSGSLCARIIARCGEHSVALLVNRQDSAYRENPGAAIRHGVDDLRAEVVELENKIYGKKT